MFTNKINDMLKVYLDRYLFGFDKNQLNLSILKGNINLKSVNIRPDEANRIIDGLMLPISLKAGMIGNLQIKVTDSFNQGSYQLSILSVWTNPLELTIDDLYLILGPNMSFLSHDESYIEDEDLDESYDSTNVFNIFEHELQIKKKIKNIDKTSKDTQSSSSPDENGEDSVKSNFNNLMKNLKLTINKLHIRFEDDYFSAERPYSFGIVIDKFELQTADTEWSFDNLLSLNFLRVRQQHQEQENRNEGVIILKELNLQNARVYFNSMSELFIPSSLWEQTRHLENQIFDAMPVESLKDLMKEAFTSKDNSFYLMSDFNLTSSFYIYKQNPALQSNQNIQSSKMPQNNNAKPFALSKIRMIFTPFRVQVTPQLIDDFSKFYDFMQNFSISLDLKQYRPQRRPICLSEMNNQDIQDDHIKRKRKLIVRDWFFFVVWYVRLRNLLVNYYSEQLLEQEIENHQEKYEGLISAAKSGKGNIKNYMEEQTRKHQNDQGDPQAEQDANQRKYDDVLIELKFESLNLCIFEDLNKFRNKGQSIPSFELNFDTLAFESHSNFIQNQIQQRFVFKDMKLFHTQHFTSQHFDSPIQGSELDYGKATIHSNSSNNQNNLNENMRCLTERENFSKLSQAQNNNKPNPGQLYLNQQSNQQQLNRSALLAQGLGAGRGAMSSQQKNSSTNLGGFVVSQRQQYVNIRQGNNNASIGAALGYPNSQINPQGAQRKQIRSSDYNQSNIEIIMNESQSNYKEMSSQYVNTGGNHAANQGFGARNDGANGANMNIRQGVGSQYTASMISNQTVSQNEFENGKGINKIQNYRQQEIGQQQSQNSIFDLFGIKQTFENFFEKIAGNLNINSQNQATANNTQQFEIQSQRSQENTSSFSMQQNGVYQGNNRLQQIQSPQNQSSTHSYFENNSRMNNTVNIQTVQGVNAPQTKYTDHFKTPYKGRLQNVAPVTNYGLRNQNASQQDQYALSAPQNARRQYNQSSNAQGQSQAMNENGSGLIPLVTQEAFWFSEEISNSTRSQLSNHIPVLRTQILHVSPANPQNKTKPGFLLDSLKLFSQNQRALVTASSRPSSINVQVELGNAQLQYCNEIIKNACEVILAYKQLHVFRYVPLKNLFMGRENLNRKLQLHAPLYLIKKLFVTSHQSSQSMKQSILSNPSLPQMQAQHMLHAEGNQTKGFNILSEPNQFSKQQKTTGLTKAQNDRPQQTSEDENISDNEDQDQKHVRKQIQNAVSAKSKGGIQIDSQSLQKFDQFKQEISQRRQVLDKAKGSQNENQLDDEVFLKKAILIEQVYSKVDMSLNVSLNYFEVIVLEPRVALDQRQQIMMRLMSYPQVVNLYKRQKESGFKAFGLQFQTQNKFQMMYFFAKNLRNALDRYLLNPSIQDGDHNSFREMREVFRKINRPFDQKKTYSQSNNARETIKQIMQEPHSQSPANLIFNAQGVKEQEDLFNQGKFTLTKKNNSKKQSQYDAMFAQMDDDNNNHSSHSQTPQLSYKNLNLNESNKAEYYVIKENTKLSGQVGQHLGKPSEGRKNLDDSELNMQVQYTEENEEDEERKALKNQINGSQDTPLITAKRRSQNVSSNANNANMLSPSQKLGFSNQDQAVERKYLKDLASPRFEGSSYQQDQAKSGASQGATFLSKTPNSHLSSHNQLTNQLTFQNSNTQLHPQQAQSTKANNSQRQIPPIGKSQSNQIKGKTGSSLPQDQVKTSQFTSKTVDNRQTPLPQNSFANSINANLKQFQSNNPSTVKPSIGNSVKGTSLRDPLSPPSDNHIVYERNVGSRHQQQDSDQEEEIFANEREYDPSKLSPSLNISNTKQMNNLLGLKKAKSSQNQNQATAISNTLGIPNSNVTLNKNSSVGSGSSQYQKNMPYQNPQQTQQIRQQVTFGVKSNIPK